VIVPELSPIEQRIVVLVAAGRSNAAIAAELGVRPRTIEWHLERARRKLEQTAALQKQIQPKEG
jgi:DNA-binding CsgD family transcriptional regulator